MTDGDDNDQAGLRPRILRWSEGAALIRAAPDKVGEQIAWSGFFAMSQGVDRKDNVPCGDVDALFIAKAFLAFGAKREMLTQALQGKLIDLTWSSVRARHTLMRVEEGQAICRSVTDARIGSLVRLFLETLDDLMGRGVFPIVPLDFSYLCILVLRSLSPIAYIEAILAGEDFRDL